MKIAVASGKGGTGKTTLSTNLSAYLSEGKSVVLTDLDVEEPNSALFIDGILSDKKDIFRMVPSWEREKCILCGECQSVCNFNSIIKIRDEIMIFPEMCHSCYACSELCPSGSLPMIPEKMGELKRYNTASFDFVESRLDIGQEQAVPLISQTLDFIDEHFPDEYIKIYDCPPGTSCPVIESVKGADFIILVTEPTPFGLHDLTLAVDTVRSLNKEFGVVINRYGIGNDDVIDYCRKEDIQIIARFPNSRKIAELYSKGRLVYRKIDEFRIELLRIEDFLSSFGDVR